MKQPILKQRILPIDYVLMLRVDIQLEIARRLRNAGICGDDFDRAMNSRLCDLSDTIEIGDLT